MYSYSSSINSQLTFHITVIQRGFTKHFAISLWVNFGDKHNRTDENDGWVALNSYRHTKISNAGWRKKRRRMLLSTSNETRGFSAGSWEETEKHCPWSTGSRQQAGFHSHNVSLKEKSGEVYLRICAHWYVNPTSSLITDCAVLYFTF